MDYLSALYEVDPVLAKQVEDSVPVVAHKAHTDLYKITNKIKRERNKDLMKKYRSEHTICECCNTANSEHTHHIIHFSDGGLDVYDNYLAVCLDCHYELHPELPDYIKQTWFC